MHCLPILGTRAYTQDTDKWASPHLLQPHLPIPCPLGHPLSPIFCLSGRYQQPAFRICKGTPPRYIPLSTVYILLLFQLAYILVCHCLATALFWVVVSIHTPYLIITGTPLLLLACCYILSLLRLPTLSQSPYPLLVCRLPWQDPQLLPDQPYLLPLQPPFPSAQPQHPYSHLFRSIVIPLPHLE